MGNLFQDKITYKPATTHTHTHTHLYPQTLCRCDVSLAYIYTILATQIFQTVQQNLKEKYCGVHICNCADFVMDIFITKVHDKSVGIATRLRAGRSVF
jgi:hypothetical protein